MKTFIEFLKESINEQRHSYGSHIHSWGLIHPNGSLISGDQHPTATTHAKLRSTVSKENPSVPQHHYADYLHYTQNTETQDGVKTTLVRSSNKHQHSAALKSLKHNLPIAQKYDHYSIDSHGDETHKDFNSEKELRSHISKLAK